MTLMKGVIIISSISLVSHGLIVGNVYHDVIAFSMFTILTF